MKKLIILFFVCVFVFIATGCVLKNDPVIETEETSTTADSTTILDNTINENDMATSEDITIKTEETTEIMTEEILSETNVDDVNSQENTFSYFYLIEESEENLISVQVPCIQSDNADEINAKIKELLLEELSLWIITEKIEFTECDVPSENIADKSIMSEYSDTYLNISSEVTLLNDSLVSIIFFGEQYYRFAAHPNKVFFTVNVDMNTSERKTIADFYSIDDNLYSDFIRFVSSENVTYDELISMNIFNKESFVNGLKNEAE